LSSHWLKRGWSLNRSRKTAMLLCVLGVMPVVFVTQVAHMWLAVFLVGLATAAHQGWSSNLYTSISDMYPKHTVASVAGIGGTAGSIGAMSLLALTSRLFNAQLSPTATGGTDHVYTVLFIVAGLAYLSALGCFHFLVPRLEPVRPSQLPDRKTMGISIFIG
jgi:ACS family hexuronate transporter-like MFS transporter